MVEQFANNASSNLSSTINASVTSLTVVDGSAFSSSGNFRIIVDSEIMLVTARTTNTLTVVRGQEGTVATSHNSGTQVVQIVTAGAIQKFRSDTVISDVFANRPTAGVAGRIFYPTDGNIIFIDNGTSWLPIGPYVPLTQVPAASSFTVFKTGNNVSVTDDSGGVFVQVTSAATGTPDSILVTQVKPGTSYTCTIGFNSIPGEANGSAGLFNYSLTGIGIYNNVNTQYESLIFYQDAGGQWRIQLRAGSSLRGNIVLGFDQGGYGYLNGPMVWMRVVDNGTTRTWQVSTDGRHFVRVGSEASTANFSAPPTHVGLYLSDESNADVRMNVLSFSLTSP